MTATVTSPARIWAQAHRLLLSVVAIVVALAAAATIAVTLSTSGSAAPASTPAVSWPVPPETLTDEEKCVMAHVRVC